MRLRGSGAFRAACPDAAIPCLLTGCAVVALHLTSPRSPLAFLQGAHLIQEPEAWNPRGFAASRPTTARPVVGAKMPASSSSWSGLAGLGAIVAFAACARGLRVVMQGGQSGRYIHLRRPTLKGARRTHRLRLMRKPGTWQTRKVAKRYLMYELLEKMPAEWEVMEEPEEPLDPVENVPLQERYPWAGTFVDKMHPARRKEEEEEPMRPWFGNYLGGFKVPSTRVEKLIDRKGYPRHGHLRSPQWALSPETTTCATAGFGASVLPAGAALAGAALAGNGSAVKLTALGTAEGPVGRAPLLRSFVPAALLGAAAAGHPEEAFAEEDVVVPPRIGTDPYELIKGPDGVVGKEEFFMQRKYKQDTDQVLKHMKISASLDKGTPNMEKFNVKVKEEMNDWLAMYRRQDKVASRQSYSTLATAINTLASHIVSYGPKFPFPTKRRERIFELFRKIEKYLKKEERRAAKAAQGQ